MKTRYKILIIIGVISLSGFISLKYYEFPDTSENKAKLDCSPNYRHIHAGTTGSATCTEY